MTTARPPQSWRPIGVLAGAVLGAIAVSITPLAGVALLGVLGGAALLLFPVAAVPLLVGASALNRLALPWGDSQIRFEILFVLLLAVVLADRLAVRTLPLKALRTPLLAPILAYAFLNLFSTLLLAQEKSRGLKLDAEIFSAVLTYVAVTALIWRRRDLEIAMRALWVVTVGEAAIGLLLFLTYVVHVQSYGVQLGDFGLPMAYGTAWEANIFGSLLLGNFFLLLADYVRGRRSGLHLAGLILVLCGIGASLTRTVWLALIIGILIFVVTVSRRGRAGGSLLPLLAGLPILALGGLIVGSATPFAARILDIVNLHSSSASGRFTIFNAALTDWRSHPLFGSGTGSFNFGAAPGQAHPWLPNLFLLTLHDTGLFGAAGMLLLIFTFYRHTLGAARVDHDAAVLVAGSLAGFTALLVAFQTTSGFWFVYPWIVTGFGMAAARLVRLGEPPVEPRGSASAVPVASQPGAE